MAEKLTINREIYLSSIVATDGDLALLVAGLETIADESVQTPEELDKATGLLEAKAVRYGLTVDEMNRVYELIRANLVVAE